MGNDPPTERRPLVPRHWIILGVAAAIHAAVGTYAGSVELFGAENTQDTVVPFALIGFFISQPFLLAFWATFAPQRFAQRFLGSFILCALLSLAEETGSLSQADNVFGADVLAGLAIFLIATMLLSIVRQRFRWQMQHSAVETTPFDYPVKQFGIKHLIIAITLTGLTCGVMRSLFILTADKEGSPPAAQAAGVLGMLFVLSLPVLVIPWYAMAPHMRASSLVSAVVKIGAVCDLLALVCIATFAASISAAPTFDVYGKLFFQMFLPFQLGAAISVFLTALAMRAAGFRMVRVPDKSA